MGDRIEYKLGRLLHLHIHSHFKHFHPVQLHCTYEKVISKRRRKHGWFSPLVTFFFFFPNS